MWANITVLLIVCVTRLVVFNQIGIERDLNDHDTVLLKTERMGTSSENHPTVELNALLENVSDIFEHTFLIYLVP